MVEILAVGIQNFLLPRGVNLARCIRRNMSQDTSSNICDGFCIYINTLCQGPVPVVSDEDGYCVFKTELEAQREIVDNQMTRLRQFLDGEREFEDAMAVEEYVVPCTVHPDGVITDADGNCFGPKVL